MPKNTNSKQALKNSLLRNAVEKIRQDAVNRAKSNKRKS